MFLLMLEPTLDNYSIKRKFLNIANDSSSVRRNHGERTMIISAANSYDVSYDNHDSLFRAGHEKGNYFIEALYEAIPTKTKVMYLLYTNIFAINHASRMMQDLWAFPSQKEANKFMDEMKDAEKLVPYSHLIKLPVRLNFIGTKWIASLHDPHYDDDRYKFVENYLATHSIGKHNDPYRYNVKLIDDKAICEMAKHAETAGLALKATEYNERVKKYRIDVIQEKLNETQQAAISGQLHHEYNNFYHHVDITRPSSGLLARNRKR